MHATEKGRVDINSYSSAILVILACISYLDLQPASGEPGYLKFCSDDQKELMYSTSCQSGLWLNIPVTPGCVCATGVWALSDGFCDAKTAIIVGQDHCFHVGFDVRSIKFIGNPTDPFEPNFFAAPSDMDVIYPVPEDGLSQNIVSDRSILIGINPNRPVEREDHTVCVDLAEESKWKPVHIFANPSRSADQWHFGIKQKCHSPTDYTYHLGFGEMFKNYKILSKDLIGRDCQEQCPPTPMLSRSFGRSLEGNSSSASKSKSNATTGSKGTANAPGRSRVTEDKIVKLNMTLDDEVALPASPKTPVRKPVPVEPHIVQRKTLQEMEYEKQKERAQVLIDLDDYHQEVNEQTLRMMHAQISPILLNSNNSELATKEYAYFQKARLVVEKLCPAEFVPKNLLRGLMRMFKQLLWESIDHERPHMEAADQAQFDRIMSILDNCTNIPQMDRYAFYNYTGSFNYSGRDPSDPSWPKPEQCPEPLVYGIWGRASESSEYHVLENITSGFWPHLKFNISLVDFTIETAWKVVMTGHYQCSKSFSGLTATDFASFFHQMELLFNDKIIKRWYDPINVNNTLKIVELIFPTYDLKRFAFGLDACMFGAQQYSNGFDYNSKWIQRPKIPFTKNELTQDIYYIPGLTHPISTSDYSPRINRKKREVSMWDGKGKCMESYMDPVEQFGYIPKPDCKLETEG